MNAEGAVRQYGLNLMDAEGTVKLARLDFEPLILKICIRN